MARFTRLVPLAIALFAVGCIVESFADFYEGCDLTSDCVGTADSCYVVAWFDGTTGFDHSGGMCSAACIDDFDCPIVPEGDGVCVELTGDPGRHRICYQTCFDHIDCAPGFQCADAIDSFGNPIGSICMPG